MKKFIQLLIAGTFVLFIASPVMTVASPAPVSAGANCETRILGIPPWYRGLTNADCTITTPTDSTELSGFIWRIILNIVQIILVAIAYIAGFFILYAGFLFMTGGSNPSQVEKARKTITNAVIGLFISLAAVAITNFIFGIVGSAPSVTGEVPQLTGEQLLKNALDMVYFIAGLVAVLVIIFSGISYVTSAGDTGKATKARNMLTYAVVGLIVVFIAFIITSFVIERFS